MTTTSSFRNLAGGGGVRFDFSEDGFASSLSYQLLDRAGQPIGAVQPIYIGRTSSVSAEPFTHIDTYNAAATEDGGFVVAYALRETTNHGVQSETLVSDVFGADGTQREFHSFAAGVNLGTGVTFPILGVLAFGDGRHGLLYDSLDGAVATSHLAVLAPTGERIDVPLASRVVGMSRADSDVTLVFGNGDQVMVGGPAHASLAGGEGNDTLVGASAPDLLLGGAGNDSVVGGVAFDSINGNTGSDTASGGLGDDWVMGGKDNDSLSGDAGADLVFGNIGADTCLGGDGADVVRGGQDDDVVVGGAGDDYVSGDRGADTVTGGAGADLFHTFGDAGVDRVTDFHLAEGDRVLLDPGTRFTVSQVGADTVIDMTGGARMILVGVQMSTLAGDWIFGS